jgi:hypothetical protein
MAKDINKSVSSGAHYVMIRAQHDWLKKSQKNAGLAQKNSFGST